MNAIRCSENLVYFLVICLNCKEIFTKEERILGNSLNLPAFYDFLYNFRLIFVEKNIPNLCILLSHKHLWVCSLFHGEIWCESKEVRPSNLKLDSLVVIVF
jgi:hypothetical protein